MTQTEDPEQISTKRPAEPETITLKIKMFAANTLGEHKIAFLPRPIDEQGAQITVYGQNESRDTDLNFSSENGDFRYDKDGNLHFYFIEEDQSVIHLVRFNGADEFMTYKPEKGERDREYFFQLDV